MHKSCEINIKITFIDHILICHDIVRNTELGHQHTASIPYTVQRTYCDESYCLQSDGQKLIKYVTIISINSPLKANYVFNMHQFENRVKFEYQNWIETITDEAFSIMWIVYDQNVYG